MTNHLASNFGTAVVLTVLSMLPTASRADDPARSPARPAVLPSALAASITAQKVVLPPPEPDNAVGSAISGPFGKVLAATTGQTLTAPVTVNANTSADAMTVTQTGGGRAVDGAVTSSSNVFSAVKGITVGSGSGVNGVNSGTTGPAGKFEITNASSAQPSLLVTTSGTGSGLQAVIKSNTANYTTPAVFGQNNGATGNGIGVQGLGGFIGVRGDGGNGVTGYGVFNGVTGYGYAGGNGVHGESESGGAGVSGSSDSLDSNSFGVYGESAHYAGVFGQSGVAIGVYGVSDSGKGVVGVSRTGYAGFFQGSVFTTSSVFAQSFNLTSDRGVKQDLHDIDGSDILQRISDMPIGGWDFQTTPGVHHIGPMAQDFRSAFGLGADDKHIDVVDGIGVSLAGIQELQRQLKLKDERLAAQDERIASLEAQQNARMAALEEAVATVMAAHGRQSSP